MADYKLYGGGVEAELLCHGGANSKLWTNGLTVYSCTCMGRDGQTHALTDPWETDETLLHVSLPLDMEANEKSP